MVSSLSRVACCVLLVAGCSSDPSAEPSLSATSRDRATPKLGPGAPVPPLPTSEEPVTGAAGASPAPEEPTDSCSPSQFVLRPDVSNARDLGGVALAQGRVACGAAFRGPPLQLSEQGCTELKGLGLRTVVDLRTEGERLGSPQSACVTANVVTAPLPIPYGLGPEDYLRDLNTDESIAKVFHTFGDPSAYPIYFHCTYGRDRTGVVGALLLLTLGASRQVVMDEYLLSAPNVGAYPNALEAVLDEVERRGGPDALLRGLGISDEELAVLRQHAVAP